MNYRNATVALVMTGSLGISSLLPTTVFANSAAAASQVSPILVVSTADSTSQNIPAKLTQDQAVAIVKAVLSIPTDTPSYASLDNNFYGPAGNNRHPVWNLGWQLGKPGDKENGNINAVVDAVDGTLLNFNTWNTADQNSTFPPKITQEQAASIVLDLIRKIQPDKATFVKEVQNPVIVNQGSLRGPFMYNLSFQRTVNNIPVLSDGFQISISGNGTVTNYSYQWSDVAPSAFPDPKQAIPETKATQVYDQNLKMQLDYEPFYGPFQQNGPEIHLIYQPNLSTNTPYNPAPYFGGSGVNPMWIDATNGNLIDNFGKPVSPGSSSQAFQVIDPNGKDTDPAPLVQPLTSDQALEIAKTYVQVDDSYSLNQSMNNYNGRKTYSFNWNKNTDPKSGPGIWLSVAIDASTGQLLNLNVNKPMPNQQPPASVISENAAKQKAIDFLKKVMPNKTGALYWKPSPKVIIPKGPKGPDQKNPNQYFFAFGELVNGIPSDINNVNVTVNAATGDIDSFFQNSYGQSPETKYPDPKNVISADQAKTDFEATNPLALEYVRPLKEDSSGPADQYILVYAPSANKPGEVLDAVNGEWTSPNGQDVSGQKMQATDIKGHWAEKQLQLMIDRGILKVTDGKVHPDATITKGDLIRMLVLSIGAPLQISASQSATFNDVSAKSEYFPYVETAVANHWIDKGSTFNPEAQVTREELAQLLTRALGYEDLAKFTSIFNVPFADKDQITKNYLGDVAIVDGLSIMQGFDNQFYPKQKVTTAQAAVALVKTVEAINSKSLNGPVYYIRQLQQKAAKMK